MVSSGTVHSDLSSISSSLSNYSSETGSLAGSWQGPSYDSFSSKTEEFVSEYKSALESCMNAFATACDLYLEYKNAKDNLKIAQDNYGKATDYYNRAASCNDSAGMSRAKSDMNQAKTEIDKYTKIMEEKKVQIEANLQSASSVKLTASSMSNSANSSVGLQNNSANGGLQQISVTGSNVLNGNVIDTSKPVGAGTKYNLSDDDLAYLGYVAKREQGSVGGAKLELSLMANLYEKNQSKYSNVVDYVQNSGWFSSYSTSGYSYPGDEYVSAAKEVIANGNRYFSNNVVEHDCLSDISSISTGSVKDRSSYIPGETVIKNKYGAEYVFVGFAPDGGDPFGYMV